MSRGPAAQPIFRQALLERVPRVRRIGDARASAAADDWDRTQVARRAAFNRTTETPRTAAANDPGRRGRLHSQVVSPSQ